MDAPLYTRLAAAYVRGKLRCQTEKPLTELGEDELQALVQLGRERGLPERARVLRA